MRRGKFEGDDAVAAHAQAVGGMMGPDASRLSIFDGSDQAVAPLSTAQLPEANGFAGRKFFWGAGAGRMGEGGFSGTPAVNTELRVRYRVAYRRMRCRCNGCLMAR